MKFSLVFISKESYTYDQDQPPFVYLKLSKSRSTIIFTLDKIEIKIALNKSTKYSWSYLYSTSYLAILWHSTSIMFLHHAIIVYYKYNYGYVTTQIRSTLPHGVKLILNILRLASYSCQGSIFLTCFINIILLELTLTF